MCTLILYDYKAPQVIQVLNNLFLYVEKFSRKPNTYGTNIEDIITSSFHLSQLFQYSFILSSSVNFHGGEMPGQYSGSLMSPCIWDLNIYLSLTDWLTHSPLTDSPLTECHTHWLIHSPTHEIMRPLIGWLIHSAVHSHRQELTNLFIIQLTDSFNQFIHTLALFSESFTVPLINSCKNSA